jgi:DNA-binding protein Fis
MKINRYFTEGKETQYPGIEWAKKNSKITNSDGSSVFEANDIQVPSGWSQVATDILAQKYFRRKGIPKYLRKVEEPGIPEWLQRSVPDNDKLNSLNPEDRYYGENDARQVFHRLAGCWTYWGFKYGYFSDEESAKAFYEETIYMLASQMAAPNSPQWFNTGLVADAGSIFLDEISTIPPETQARLLRVIQEREFTPLGDTQPRRVDTRIIAATNTDLQRAVKNGDFREDLFYRLNVINIHLPPLRNRKEDILPLAQYFIRKYNDENGRSITDQVSPEVLSAIETYAWPGNVRELETAIERAVIIARGNEITMECLRGEIIQPPTRAGATGDMSENAAALDVARGISFYDEVSRFEIELIRRALEITGGHQSRAAKLLGMNNTTLNSKIKVYNIKI